MLGALLAAALMVAVKPAPAAQSGDKFVGPLKLYTFLVGTLLVPDPAEYGLQPQDVTTDRLAAASYLIVHPKGTLLWEAGLVPDELVGSDKPEAERAMKSQLDHLGDLGYSEKGITYLALSHAHSDHTGDANSFASSTWLVRQAERDAMFSSTPYPGATPAYFAKLKDSKTVLITGDHDVFGDGRVVLKPAPGHTPGHQVLFVNLPNTGPIVLAGDLYHYAEQRTLNRLSTLDVDPAQANASREAIEAFVKQTAAQLWIQHDYEAHGKRRQSPAFYD